MWTPEKRIEYSKVYREVYNKNRMFHCGVCNEDMKQNNKHRHLNKDYHLVAVENMISRGEEVPSFKRSADKNWKCPICADGFIYKNKSQHAKSGNHKDNIAKLVSKGLPVPNIFVNGKFLKK